MLAAGVARIEDEVYVAERAKNVNFSVGLDATGVPLSRGMREVAVL